MDLQRRIDLDRLDLVDDELAALRRADDRIARFGAILLLLQAVRLCLADDAVHIALFYATSLDRFADEDDGVADEAKLRVADLFLEACAARIAETLLHRWKLTRRHQARRRARQAPITYKEAA
jgi:hypothetical protein